MTSGFSVAIDDIDPPPWALLTGIIKNACNEEFRAFSDQEYD
jgi:hypothetical protein